MEAPSPPPAAQPASRRFVAVPPAPESRTSRHSIANTSWQFIDGTGAVFSLTFMPGGSVASPTYSHFWKWEQVGSAVRITYANTLG